MLTHRLASLGLRLAGVAVALALSSAAVRGQMSMTMPMEGSRNGGCQDPVLACAATVTPAFAPDGTLWLAFTAGDRVFVVHSADLGRHFSSPVAVTPARVKIDNGPDARPAIAIDRQSRVFVAYAIFKDDKYNGEVFFSRSLDRGATFSPPRPLVGNSTASQRFATLTVGPSDHLFAAWLDKRDVVAAEKQGKAYPGAALAYSWSLDGGKTFSPSRIAHDNTCECCRVGVAFRAADRPVVLFRNVFSGSIRDHAVMTFADRMVPGPIDRVSVDHWVLDGCPHAGPSLAVSSAGTYDAAWFTEGDARKGVFYARSTDGGQSFSNPMALGNPDHQLSRPYVTALKGATWIAWKDFDGTTDAIDVRVSHDDGLTWSGPRTAAATSDASDQPLLVTDGRQAYLSWMTQREGYHFLQLGRAQ